MKKLFEVSFKGTEELLKLAEEQARLLAQNTESAVANTVLLGIARIANDAPVDTGRLQASIAGELAEAAGVSLEGETQAIAEGKAQSVTSINGLEGRIGTNVEYALYQEYGTAGRKVGVARRPGAVLYAGGIRGKGFFRRNIPVLRNHLNEQMERAIQATREGRLLRKGN